MSSINQNSIKQFTHLELIARQVVEGFITGLHKSPFHGFSVEFAEHRLYNTGEPTRHIDWKLYGKTDKLFVKRYEEETNLRCQIVIDNSSSMYFPVTANSTIATLLNNINSDKTPDVNKITFSAYAAATLIELLRRQRDASGLTVFSDQIEFNVLPKLNSVHNKLVMSELEKLIAGYNVNTHKKTSVVNTLHQIAEFIHKRSLVIIFTDMFDSNSSLDELFNALQHLKHKKHEVVVFDVNDKSKEIDFEYENRPYRFLDMETTEEIKLYPNQIKDAYKTSIQKFKKDIYLKCLQYKIDIIDADINKGFDQILSAYLLKRKRMV